MGCLQSLGRSRPFIDAVQGIQDNAIYEKGAPHIIGSDQNQSEGVIHPRLLEQLLLLRCAAALGWQNMKETLAWQHLYVKNEASLYGLGLDAPSL